MREIKFRLWDKEYNKIIDWTEFLFRRFTFDYLIEHSDKFIIQQFTGLTDKNGREIYEGDIIKTESSSMFRKNIYEIKYYQNRFTPDDICDKNDIEVVGNIFENPELLN